MSAYSKIWIFLKLVLPTKCVWSFLADGVCQKFKNKPSVNWRRISVTTLYWTLNGWALPCLWRSLGCHCYPQQGNNFRNKEWTKTTNNPLRNITSRTNWKNHGKFNETMTCVSDASQHDFLLIEENRATFNTLLPGILYVFHYIV